MIWEAIAGGVKGLGDTILGFVREFNMNPKDAAELEQKVRQAAMDFERNMWDLERQDRDSARQREAKTGDHTNRYIAYIYTGGYFGMLAALISGYVAIEDSMKGLVDVLMGVLTAGQYSIMSYYFGSSRSSAVKQDLLAGIVQKQ
jgi:hypothetical protein